MSTQSCRVHQSYIIYIVYFVLLKSKLGTPLPLYPQKSVTKFLYSTKLKQIILSLKYKYEIHVK